MHFEDVLRFQLLRLPPEMVFEPEVISYWGIDPEDILWNAINCLPLHKLVGDISRDAHRWVLCTSHCPPSEHKSQFAKYFDDDNSEQFPGERLALECISSPDPIRGTWYFHATTWESVPSIVAGIDLQQGKRNRDFSVRGAFYLNTDYQDCKTWAIRRARDLATARVAIIAYFVPPEIFYQQPFLDLSQKAEDWQRLVSYSRRGMRHERNRHLQELLESDDPRWISGGQCANPDDVRKGKTPVPRQNFEQIALCSDKAASEFSAMTPCVVFLSEMQVTDAVRNQYPRDFDHWIQRRSSRYLTSSSTCPFF